MVATDRWLVTTNVGCASPGDWTARSQAMSAWVRIAIQERHPTLIFAQEVTDEFLQALEDSGYTVVTETSRRWKVRSAIAGAPGVELEALSEADFPTLAYHGSYLAAGLWRDSPVGDMIVVSVHASPNYADPIKYSWPVELPAPRHGGGDPRYVPGRLWDSDLVLATLGLMARMGKPVIAAGDFNESLSDDIDGQGKSRGTWGREYLDRAQQLDLFDAQTEFGKAEVPTRGRLQLDRFILAPGEWAAHLENIMLSTEPHWERESVFSDHTPLWMSISFGP